MAPVDGASGSNNGRKLAWWLVAVCPLEKALNWPNQAMLTDWTSWYRCNSTERHRPAASSPRHQLRCRTIDSSFHRRRSVLFDAHHIVVVGGTVLHHRYGGGQTRSGGSRRHASSRPMSLTSHKDPRHHDDAEALTNRPVESRMLWALENNLNPVSAVVDRWLWKQPLRRVGFGRS